MARPEGSKSEAGRAEMGGVLGEGMFPSPPAGDLGISVSSLSGVRGEAPATWQFRKFYRLTKPVLMSILLILNLLQ